MKGLIIGAVSGFVTEGLTGLISGDDPEDAFLPRTAEEKAVVSGVYLGLAGTGIGAICGATAKISIPIHGKLDLYKQNKDILSKYSIGK